jgi:hypothetical protein
MRNQPPNSTGGFKYENRNRRWEEEGERSREKGMGKRRPRPGPDPWIEVALNHFEGSTRVQKGELVHVTINRSIIDWIRSTEYSLNNTNKWITRVT